MVANAALEKAEQMQLKVETAMFDKAVKEQYKDWKGFTNTYEYDREEILNKIDTLDLSANALLRLPKEVSECKYLKSLNLLGNEDIDWDDCFKKLSSCTQLIDLKVSVKDLDQIDSVYWKHVSGIEFTARDLKNVPQNVLRQKQLTYLDISYNNISKLSPEIGDLSNLSKLDLKRNKLTDLPWEIMNLKSLTYFDLSYNKLSSLPPEIFSLNKINSNSWFIMGHQLFATENYETALKCFLKSIDKNEKLDITYYNAALCYQALGDNKKALEYFYKRLDFDENDNWTLREIRYVYYAMNNYLKAYEVAKKLIALEPNNYSNYYDLSFYCFFINKQHEAIMAAKKSLELAPDKTGVYTNLALGYVLDNEFEKAKPIYLEWKDKHFPGDERFCKEVFLKDIKELEAAGIKHKDFKKVRDLLK